MLDVRADSAMSFAEQTGCTNELGDKSTARPAASAARRVLATWHGK
jgi:hypothetical protein